MAKVSYKETPDAKPVEQQAPAPAPQQAPAPAPQQADPPPTQAVAVQPTGALPAIVEGDAADDVLAEYAGLGNEQVRINDAATPFLKVLQSNSPECSRAHPDYIKGAEAGMFFHTLYKRAYEGPLLLVDCWFEPLLIEWVPRAKGGGLVKIYPGGDPIEKTAVRVEVADEQGKPRRVDRLPNGNDLVTTAQHYFLWLNPDNNHWETVVAGLSSTQLSHSRALNALLLNEKIFDKKSGRLVQAPRFSRFIQAKTKAEQKDNNAWFGWEFTVGPRITNQVLPEALAFTKLLQAGKRLSRPSEDDLAADPAAARPAQSQSPQGRPLGDDVPF